jgi:ABC-type glycerol-3-phosphate transport system substrate-binding protein
LFYSGRLEEVLVQKQANVLNDSTDQWTLIPYPATGDKPVVFIEGSAYAILTADPQRALAAWQWIQWLLEPANQARLVEASGSFPLSQAALDELEGFRQEHPAWSQALQYLALAESVPLAAEWQMTKDVLSDYAWQLVRFTTSREDIPRLLQNAEGLFRE